MNEWEWQLLEDKPALDRVTVDGIEFSIGDRVRLCPRSGGDIMDLVLAGKIGIIESIEQDYEGKVQIAIVIDDDPGKDLGMLRQPGHRFFFNVEEIESLSRNGAAEPVPAGKTADADPEDSRRGSVPL
jgi:hypothetical protein